MSETRCSCGGTLPCPHKAPSSPTSETEPVSGTELRPCDSVACEVPWWAAATREASNALAESDALLKRASEVVAIRGVRIESLRMERDEGRAIIEGLQRVLAARDATIERLWAQLNEATNVPNAPCPESCSEQSWTNVGTNHGQRWRCDTCRRIVAQAVVDRREL